MSDIHSKLRIAVVTSSMGTLLFGGANLTPTFVIAFLGLSVVSGVLGGWLAKGLGDAIAKTGVLASFAIGQEGEEI